MKKNAKKGTKKNKAPKVSLIKLSNKRLNHLAKQGKLNKSKRSFDRKKVLGLIKDRVRPETQQHLRPEDADRRPPPPVDIPLEEADYEFFSKPGRDMSFLSESSFIDDESNKRKRKRPEADTEQDYERLPRKRATNEKRYATLLPIKSKERGVIQRREEVEEEEEEEEPEDESAEPGDDLEESDEPSQLEPLPPMSTSEILLHRKLKLTEKKQQMALLASGVLEHPEEGMRKLRELRLFLKENDPDLFLTVRKLAMVSLLEVFKDIIPGYRIRVATEKEKTQQAKKDTMQLRDFEDALVTNYRHYLEYLEVAVKGKLDAKKNTNKKRPKKEKKKKNGFILPPEAAPALREVAIRCLCELLVSHPHFNYRTNIITVIMPFVANKNQKVSDIVCGYVKRLFREDKSGDVTLEVVRLIGRIIKAKNFDVKPKVLKLFLALKIKEINKSGLQDDNKAARRAKLKKMSKKEVKQHKQMKALELELEEASAEDVKKKKIRLHTEVISMVFLSYFRILKNARHSVLLSAVLEGLAKFAHLINVDFFDDMFAVLNELVDSEELTYRESLHCVQAAFTILSGQGAALNIDPMRFYTNLYKSLFQLHAGISSEDVQIALKCLDIMINKRKKQVSQQRLLAYLKRVISLSLQLEHHGAIGVLATARGFIHAYPRSDILLDTDCQGSGSFLPELDEPEHCNAHNTALYELHTLRQHYHPVVRQYGNHVMSGAPSQGFGALPAQIGRKTALEIYEEFNPSAMTFNPPIDKHPKVKGKKRGTAAGIYFQEEVRQMVSRAEADVDREKLSKLDFNTATSTRTSGPQSHKPTAKSEDKQRNTPG